VYCGVRCHRDPPCVPACDPCFRTVQFYFSSGKRIWACEVKYPDCLSVTPRKRVGGVDVKIHSFFILVMEYCTILYSSKLPVKIDGKYEVVLKFFLYNT
jgi:hypothetical protein